MTIFLQVVLNLLNSQSHCDGEFCILCLRFWHSWIPSCHWDPHSKVSNDSKKMTLHTSQFLFSCMHFNWPFGKSPSSLKSSLQRYFTKLSTYVFSWKFNAARIVFSQLLIWHPTVGWHGMTPIKQNKTYSILVAFITLYWETNCRA